MRSRCVHAVCSSRRTREHRAQDDYWKCPVCDAPECRPWSERPVVRCLDRLCKQSIQYPPDAEAVMEDAREETSATPTRDGAEYRHRHRHRHRHRTSTSNITKHIINAFFLIGYLAQRADSDRSGHGMVRQQQFRPYFIPDDTGMPWCRTRRSGRPVKCVHHRPDPILGFTFRPRSGKWVSPQPLVPLRSNTQTASRALTEVCDGTKCVRHEPVEMGSVVLSGFVLSPAGSTRHRLSPTSIASRLSTTSISSDCPGRKLHVEEVRALDVCVESSWTVDRENPDFLPV